MIPCMDEAAGVEITKSDQLVFIIPALGSEAAIEDRALQG
jgi:hypothetical protein